METKLVGNKPYREDTSLYELQRKYTRGKIEAPKWQRGIDKWSPTKRELYIKSIILNAQSDDLTDHYMPGQILLYTMKGVKNSKLFLNDGLQRISNAVRAYERLRSQFGEDLAQELLEKIKVVTTTYDLTDDEAIDQFCKVNQGTPLTDAQLSNTVLAQHNEYLDWVPAIEQMQELIRNVCEASHLCKVRENGKLLKAYNDDDFRREVMCMAYRWLSGTTERNPIQFHPTHLRGDSKMSRGHLVEEVMKRVMDSMTPQEATTKMRELQKVLENRMPVWRSELTRVTGPTQGLNPAVNKLLILSTIQFENAKVPVGMQNEWCKALIRHVKQHSALRVKNNKGEENNTNMRSRDLADLHRAEISVKQYEFLMPCDPNAPAPELKGRLKKKSTSVRGYDSSHKTPISMSNHDDGDVFAEPSSENRVRGNKPVKKERKPSVPRVS